MCLSFTLFFVSLLSSLFAGAAFAAAETEPVPLAARLFNPPAEYRGQFGGYRSPLLFENGQKVETAQDWQRRRREILDRWHRLMGAWSPLLPEPRMENISETNRENFRQRRVRVEIAAGKMTEGWLLLPRGDGPFPAALVPFYEPETSIGLGKAGFRDFALQLTRRGFVTLSIGSPGGDARKPLPGKPDWQPLSFLACVAANCHTVLAQLPEVDPKRIGIVGHSYGGKWAMFASCLYDKFACAVWSDPGIVFDDTRPNINYWEPWYLGLDSSLSEQRKPGLPSDDNPWTGPYKVMRETRRDLHELHALMAPRPFLVSGGSEDPPSRWIPLNHAIAINQLLGYTNRVAMSNRKEHSPNAESNEDICAFFETFLKRTNSRASPGSARHFLQPIYAVQTGEMQRFGFSNKSRPVNSEGRPAQEMFLALAPTNQWPSGLVPIFAVEKTNRIELRRRPARGLEDSSEPLFFALPNEDEADAEKISGHWEGVAVRDNHSKAFPNFDLAVETNQIAGRFDPNTDYRFARINSGTFISNRLELHVQHVMDHYVVHGTWRAGALTGDYVHTNEVERGTWEATREPPLILPIGKTVGLYEWRRVADNARRYVIDGSSIDAPWQRSPRPLCRVWRASASSVP